MNGKEIVNPQALPLMTLTTAIESHKQKEKDQIVQDADFDEELTDLKVNIRWDAPVNLVITRLCQFPCKKQTAVPHSTTEAEVISFHTGMRMEGFNCVKVLGHCE